jgi:hypothetical protein
MDEQNPPEPAPGIVELVGCKQAAHADSTVTFLGDPAHVAEGFAIALRAMGVDQSEPGEDPDA